jgi:hypothetical protein
MWDTIAKYVIPREAVFYENNSKGQRRDRYVVDSTAPRSLELFAAFLFSNLNNPAGQWVDFEYEANDFDETEKRWLAAAARRHQLYLGNNTNLYTNLHENYLSLGAFGGTALLVERGAQGGIFTAAYPLKDCVFEQNAYGEIDAVYRTQMWTKRQARQRFPGRDLGPCIDKEGKAKATEEIKFIHCVFPATDEDLAKHIDAEWRGRQKATGAPYFGVWVNAADQKVVDVGLYREFPYSIPRWYKGAGETYGRSPAMTVVGDILMVNRMAETTLKGAEKLVDPPLMIPEGGLLSPVRLFPGGVTYTDGPVSPQPVIPPGASRIELGGAMIAERQTAIREGFFVPLFVTPQNPVKTATQVLQETDERNRATAPMTIRMHKEHFDRFMPRTLRIATEQGLLGEVPESIAKKSGGLRVTYNSPIVASVAQNEGLSIMRAFEGLAPWHQVDETAFDQIDVARAAKVFLEATGAPKTVHATKAEIAKKQQERAERAQQQMVAENGADYMKGMAALQSAQAK